MESVGDNAFDGQLSLTSIALPDKVTRIGENSFRNSGLVSITLPSQLKSIGCCAFLDCKKLAKVEGIPQSLAFLGKEAFSGCALLYHFDFGKTRILRLENGTFYGCVKLSEVILPANVREIGELAFANCISLRDIEFPNSLKKIESAAFLRSGLRSVYFPEGLEIIESETFAEYDFLNLVYFPESLMKIQCSAFYGCWNILSIYGKSLQDVQVDDLNFGLYNAKSPANPVLP